ncbi:MAG TPA: feruloyl-CoA synthase [Solirubrobacteraceae bacterium]|nr:feruloyl-CoA synthase [Solirubrobacteraceae bacterium]
MTTDVAAPPERDELFAPRAVRMHTRADGTRLLAAEQPLGTPARSLAHLLRAGAEAHLGRLLIAERSGRGWRTLTWGEARAGADAIAQALIERGLGAGRPLMILSGNSIDHLLLTLGALTAGVPVLPISPAYSLNSRDTARIRSIAQRCRPGLVYAEDGEAFGGALAALRDIVPLQAASRRSSSEQEPFDVLLAVAAGEEVERAFAAIAPDTVAKVLFSSGSTGEPKGVINTHGMLCANQQSIGQVWPFLHEEPPVLVDWLPWSHTFGGNHNLGQVLAHGGTMYIDPGRPAPGAFEATIDCLREIGPTIYYNVPGGWALLATALESDAELRENFFSRLRLMFYAAAALPESVWMRLRATADGHTPREIPLTASWGCTESSPAATSAHFRSARCGCIGVPMPGVEVKLAPEGEKLEIRLRGPSITPGYLGDPAATAAAFDHEGFYRTGDAVRLVDPADAGEGLIFDGRLAEDFKLVTGTWVHVGALRTRLLSEAPILRDAVICGHDRDTVGAMAWLDPSAAGPQVRDLLRAALDRLAEGAGSSQRIDRLLLLDEPPSIEAGEITDKGYINQGAVLRRRAREVEALYAEGSSGVVARST